MSDKPLNGRIVYSIEVRGEDGSWEERNVYYSSLEEANSVLNESIFEAEMLFLKATGRRAENPVATRIRKYVIAPLED